MIRDEILLTYLQNNQDWLDNEVRNLASRFARRDPETGDGLQLELAIERSAMFKAVSMALFELSKMSDPTTAPINYIGMDEEYLKYQILRQRERITRTTYTENLVEPVKETV